MFYFLFSSFYLLISTFICWYRILCKRDGIEKRTVFLVCSSVLDFEDYKDKIFYCLKFLPNCFS